VIQQARNDLGLIGPAASQVEEAVQAQRGWM
jgi:hypothetical protein